MKLKTFAVIVLSTVLLIGGLSLAQAAPPAQTEGDGQEYVVQADDWLSKIADKFYGDMLAYPTIVEATNAKAADDDSFTMIDNPDIIEIGQKLWIPGAEMAMAEEMAEDKTAEGEIDRDQIKQDHGGSF